MAYPMLLIYSFKFSFFLIEILGSKQQLGRTGGGKESKGLVCCEWSTLPFSSQFSGPSLSLHF